MNLYRVIQEALNNCNKYAKATQIYVKIDADGQGNNTLSIIDNGKGFKTHKIKKGIGIKNMLERAESIGGTFNVKSEINKGTTIVLKFNTFLK
jgi:signal transduction histidine kinase